MVNDVHEKQPSTQQSIAAHQSSASLPHFKVKAETPNDCYTDQQLLVVNFNSAQGRAESKLSPFIDQENLALDPNIKSEKSSHQEVDTKQSTLVFNALKESRQFSDLQDEVPEPSS